MHNKGAPPKTLFLSRMAISLLLAVFIAVPAWVMDFFLRPFGWQPSGNLGQALDTNIPADIYGFTGVSAERGVKGWFFIHHPQDVWEYRSVKPYGFNRCVETHIGWKINGVIGRNDGVEKAVFVWRVNPFKRYGA